MPRPPFLREIRLVPVKRPKGKVSVQLGPKEDPTDCFKDRAAWLLESLGAYYSHRAGYCLSPQRAIDFRRLYRNGWVASRRLMRYWKNMERDKTPYTYTLCGGRPHTLKEALAKCSVNHDQDAALPIYPR